MGDKEYTQAVKGSGQEPVSTSQKGSIETNNYREGDSIVAETYPYTINPDYDIQEIGITETGEDIRVNITTISGNIIGPIHLKGSTTVFDFIDADKVEIVDPNNTGVNTYGWVVGE